MKQLILSTAKATTFVVGTMVLSCLWWGLITSEYTHSSGRAMMEIRNATTGNN